MAVLMVEKRRDIWKRFAVVLALQMSLFGISAFFQQFSLFRFWDDEGGLMMSLNQFLQGNALYSHMYAQYGPVYYLFHAILNKITGLGVTHDSIRGLTILMRLSIAALSGAVVVRITRSVTAGALACLLAFMASLGLINEPGHPQGLCLLVLFIAALLACWQRLEMPMPVRAFFLGAAGGLLVMTKINLGIFYMVALALSLAFSASMQRWMSVVRAALLIAGIALPVILMSPFLTQQWALLLAASVVAPMVAVWLLLRSHAEKIPLLSSGAMATAGLLASVALIGGTVLLGETTASDLLHGVLLQHIGFENVFRFPISFNLPCLAGSLALLAWGVLLGRKTVDGEIQASRKKLLLACIMITAGLACCLAVFLGADHLADSFIPLLGLLALSIRFGSSNAPFGRLFLCLLAVLELLWVFPVAGSQRACASVLAVTGIAVLLHDGFSMLPQLSRRRAGYALIIALLSLHLFVLFTARNDYRTYRSHPPLALPGASLLRLPADQSRVFRELTAFLSANADAFVTYPGMNSLYFWTGQDSPLSKNTTHWMTLLKSDEQQQLVDELQSVEQSKRVLLVQNKNIINFWMQGRTILPLPLVKHLSQRFPRQVASFGDYVVYAQ